MKAAPLSLLVCGRRWWRISGGTAREWVAATPADDRLTALWHPPRSVSGAERLTEGVKHASMLIARRVREEGLVEGVAHVMVHAAARLDSEWVVPYTAMSEVDWFSLHEWLARQEQPVRLGGAAVVATQACRPGRAVLLLTDSDIVYVVRLPGRVVVASAALFSLEVSDLATAWASVSVRAVAQVGDAALLDATPIDIWPLAHVATLERFRDHIQQSLGPRQSVAFDDVQAFEVPGEPVQTLLSAAPSLAASLKWSQTLGTLGCRAGWLADRSFVPAVSVLGVSAVAAMGLAALLYNGANVLDERTAVLQAESARAERELVALPPAQPDVSARAAAQVKFLRELGAVARQPDVVSILKDLEAAARGRVVVHVLRGGVPSAAAAPAHAATAAASSAVAAVPAMLVMIEVSADPSASGDSAASISSFVAGLVARGYQVAPDQPSGPQVKTDRTLFRLAPPDRVRGV